MLFIPIQILLQKCKTIRSQHPTTKGCYIVTLSGPNDIFRADLRDHQRDCYILDRAFVAFLVYIYTYLGENHIVHRFCLGRVGGSRSSDAPATGWVFVQLIVYSPYVNRTWSLIAFTIFLQVSSFRAASYTREENPEPEKLTNRMNSVPNAEDT